MAACGLEQTVHTGLSAPGAACTGRRLPGSLLRVRPHWSLLAARCSSVVGRRSSVAGPSLRALAPDHPDLVFIEGDFFTADLPAEHYDFICSVTTIHHLDHEAALLRMRELLRPGGTLVVGRDPGGLRRG
jgi:SAM-dependent methyltransferase